MKNKKTKFFSYSGTKIKYTDRINRIINTSKNELYVEPFVGAGAIFFNLEKTFKKYIINDIDENIIKIYNSFKVINFDDYTNQVHFVYKEFGAIGKNKSSYYEFREYFNNNFYNTNLIEEGIYLHFLANSCINSFLRFGPTGMNQSFGNRFYVLEDTRFTKIQARLSNTEICNTDYKDIIRNNQTGLFFLDPPYFSQKSSYSSFSLNQFLEYLDVISNLEYIYTDLKNEYNCKLNSKFIRDMANTAPSSDKSQRGNLEYIFLNKINEPVAVDLFNDFY